MHGCKTYVCTDITLIDVPSCIYILQFMHERTQLHTAVYTPVAHLETGYVYTAISKHDIVVQVFPDRPKDLVYSAKDGNCHLTSLKSSLNSNKVSVILI